MLGPYKIIAKVGPQSYTLQLPREFRRVHPVYHISMLEPHLPSSIPGRVASPPPPVEIDGDVEYEISEIVDSKIDKRRKCPLLYRVRWLGYENTDDEFEWILLRRRGCVAARGTLEGFGPKGKATDMGFTAQ